MQLDEIQDIAIAALKADTSLSTTDVFADDGTYLETGRREDAAAGCGIAIIVIDPQPTDGGDQAPDGSGGVYGTQVFVVVEENAKQSRLPGGANMRGITAVKHVIKTLKGLGGELTPSNGMRPASPPFIDFGTQNGLRRWLVQFDVVVPF